MKKLLVFACSLFLLSSCSSQQDYIDNGNPGQIKAVVFYDDNHSGELDDDEVPAQIEVGISQDVSCPPSNVDLITTASADANGAAYFLDLKPGKYCVHPIGNFSMTTKLTQEVYVSSDKVTTVEFGLVKE